VQARVVVSFRLLVQQLVCGVSIGCNGTLHLVFIILKQEFLKPGALKFGLLWLAVVLLQLG